MCQFIQIFTTINSKTSSSSPLLIQKGFIDLRLVILVPIKLLSIEWTSKVVGGKHTNQIYWIYVLSNPWFVTWQVSRIWIVDALPLSVQAYYLYILAHALQVGCCSTHTYDPYWQLIWSICNLSIGEIFNLSIGDSLKVSYWTCTFMIISRKRLNSEPCSGLVK